MDKILRVLLQPGEHESPGNSLSQAFYLSIYLLCCLYGI